MKHITLFLGCITLFLGGCSHLPKPSIAERRIECINDFLDRSVAAEKAHKICQDIIKEL